MSPAERAHARERVIGVLLELAKQEMTNGHVLAAGISPQIARTLGIIPAPDERLVKLTDAEACAAAVASAKEVDEANAHKCTDECDGNCGIMYFFGSVADHIMNLCATDAQRVDAFLDSLGGA